MAQVDFAPIPGRVGQRIRNELIFLGTGGGDAVPPTHRLEVAIRESVTSTLVRIDGEALGQIYAIEATFQLISIKDKKVVFQGTSHARAGFERFSRSTPTCAPARTPRTAPRDHRRGHQDPGRDLPVRRGVSRSPADGSSVRSVNRDGRRQDASGRRVSKALERVPAAVLLYGSDAGLVTERAARWPRSSPSATIPRARSFVSTMRTWRTTPAASASSCRRRPCSAGARSCAPRPAGGSGPARSSRWWRAASWRATLIVEAGSLRPDDALRALFEKSPAAAAVACFPDEARDLDAVIREVFAPPRCRSRRRPSGCWWRGSAPTARCRGRRWTSSRSTRTARARIEESDVEAAVGDAAELALDRIVMAAGARAGLPAALAECDRSVAAGESPQGIIAALQRHFLRLHRMRGALDGGRSMDEVVRTLRPPPHFKQRDALEQQCRGWSMHKLNAALARIAEAAKAARLNVEPGRHAGGAAAARPGLQWRPSARRSARPRPPCSHYSARQSREPHARARRRRHRQCHRRHHRPLRRCLPGPARRPRAACSSSMPAPSRSSTTTWGRPWRSPAARPPTPWSASPRSAAARASSARPPTTSSARSSATTSAPPG